MKNCFKSQDAAVEAMHSVQHGFNQRGWPTQKEELRVVSNGGNGTHRIEILLNSGVYRPLDEYELQDAMSF